MSCDYCTNPVPPIYQIDEIGRSTIVCHTCYHSGAIFTFPSTAPDEPPHPDVPEPAPESFTPTKRKGKAQ